MMIYYRLLNWGSMSREHVTIEIGAALANTLMKMMLKCIALI
jgi:hypothetical protein